MIFVIFHLEYAVGGFIGLSSWLPFRKDIDKLGCSRTGERLQRIRSWLSESDTAYPPKSNDKVLNTPVFLTHCKDDDVVSVTHGNDLCQSLGSMALYTEWHCYETGGHWLNEPQGVDDVVALMKKQGERQLVEPEEHIEVRFGLHPFG